MSEDRCKRCKGPVRPQPDDAIITYECGSYREIGGDLFSQSDECRIRELEQHMRELAAVLHTGNVHLVVTGHEHLRGLGMSEEQKEEVVEK